MMKPKIAGELQQMMRDVVEEGTGQAANLDGLSIAGKTGTASTGVLARSVGERQRRRPAARRRLVRRASPSNDPKIAVAVELIEHSERLWRHVRRADRGKGDTDSPWGKTMSEFDAGTIIDGRYRVLHRLGAGGMADVYLAQDEQLDREVALKLLHRRFAEDPGFVERFRREAQAAASLQHPNVVSVFDRGTFEDTYYIAMEYLDGRTLKRLIREEAPLETTRAIDLTIQMLKAARFAHRRGVIHRDLKPHNVIVDSGDHVKVTDFGIARAGASDMTETGSIMGTAQYLSPEQAQGHAVSAPSDLYSVGIVLYEMLTGRVPFDGESPVSIALKHVSEAPIPPSQFNPEIPSALEQVVLWSLNKDPADRPADADQFIMALEQVREALAAPAGEVTASMRALAAGTGLVPVGGAAHTSLMPAEAADGNGGAVGLAFDGDQLDRHRDDDQRDKRKRPIWPWIVGAGGALC